MTTFVTSIVGTREPMTLSTLLEDERPSSKKQSSIQRLSQGVTIAGIPSFTAVEKQRQWMLGHLAGAFRVFARKGYAEGLAGHISLRDPGVCEIISPNIKS